MQFAISLPWWVLVLLVAAVAAVAWGAYTRVLVPLAPRHRALLTTLRGLSLLLLVACLLRPVRVMPPATESDAVVPILVDVSRSMRLSDAGGRTRVDAARDLLVRQLRPALEGRFQSEVWTFGDTLTRAASDAFTADAPRSDLSGALRALRERYRARRLAGSVALSGGRDTGPECGAERVGGGGSPGC